MVPFIRLLTSTLVGAVTAVAAALLALLTAFAFGAFRMWWSVSDGGGDIGAFFVDIPGLSALIVIAGFLLGFYWRFKR